MPDSSVPLVQAEVGICILENYNSPPTGEALVVKSLAFPNKSPSNKTWD